ncbi:MAG TPA: hypothetical protein VFQ35_08800 [Polyangiaceae bacterium]|nr:hypothetical protein [Polyangiaceae bacterium]
MKRAVTCLLVALCASRVASAQSTQAAAPAPPTPNAPAAPAAPRDAAAAPDVPPLPNVPPPPDVPPPPSTTPEASPPPSPGDPPVTEPPLPGPPIFVLEPPPPPVPRHVAPRTSLLLGARVGWFVPFGSLYVEGVRNGNGVAQTRVDIRNYARSGPLVEFDVGARLGRNYGVFGFWERTVFSAGTDTTTFYGHGDQRGGTSDFWGAGVRATSDADHVGFATELAVGYRRARMEWEDDSAIEATESFPEARFSIGADIRVSKTFSLSPMLSFGVGGFGKVVFVDRNGKATDLIGNEGSPDNHGWFELHVGGHFDVFGRD